MILKKYSTNMFILKHSSMLDKIIKKTALIKI